MSDFEKKNAARRDQAAVDEFEEIDREVIDTYGHARAPASFRTNVWRAIEVRRQPRVANYAWIASGLAAALLVAVLWQAPQQRANENVANVALSISNISSRLSSVPRLKPRIITSMAALAPLPTIPTFEFGVPSVGDAVNASRSAQHN